MQGCAREEEGERAQTQTPFPLQGWCSHSFEQEVGVRGPAALHVCRLTLPHYKSKMKRNGTSFWTSIQYNSYTIIILSLLPHEIPLESGLSPSLNLITLTTFQLQQPPCATLLIPQIRPLNFKFLFGNENLILPLGAPSMLKILQQRPIEHMITSKFLLCPPRILSLPTYLCSTHPWLLVVF